MNEDQYYTWRSAILALCALLLVIAVAVILAVLLNAAIQPLPYNDPEPPSTARAYL